MRKARRVAALTVSLCGWMACSPSSGMAAYGPPDAGADAAAHADPVPSDSLRTITVRYWVAGCSVAEDLWKYRKSSTITCDERGRTLASAHGVMAWPEYLMAADIDTVVIEGNGLEGLQFELAWSPDDTFTAARSVRASSVSSSGHEVRFSLEGVPEWRGLVRRFRLTWRGEPSPTARIVAAWGRRQVTTAKSAGAG